MLKMKRAINNIVIYDKNTERFNISVITGGYVMFSPNINFV